MQIDQPLKQSVIGFLIASLLSLSTHALASHSLNDQHRFSGYTSQQEQTLGKEFMQMVMSELPIVSDPIANDYLQNLGFRLVASSEKPSKHYEFFIVKDSSINAFAGPDGFIGVNSGLILKTESESELAAVLAHEIAHASQNHLMRSLKQQKNMQIASIAAMVAAVAIATQNPQAGAGAVTAVTAGGAQGYLNYSREYEQEADRVAFQILSSAGFDPQSMTILLQRMEKEDRLNGSNASEYLRTHPLTLSRLSDAQNRSQQHRTKKTTKNNEEFSLIQARLAVDLGGADPKALMRQFKKNSYAYALASMNAHEFTVANHAIAQLIKQYPNQIILKMTQADIEIESGRTTEASQLLQNLYDYHADYYPLLLQYGYFLLAYNNPMKAAELLEEHLSTYSNDIRYLALLSEAQGKSKQLVKAYQTRAEIALLMENKKAAVQQLKLALQFAKNKPYEKSLIKAKLEKIEKGHP